MSRADQIKNGKLVAASSQPPARRTKGGNNGGVTKTSGSRRHLTEQHPSVYMPEIPFMATDEDAQISVPQAPEFTMLAENEHVGDHPSTFGSDIQVPMAAQAAEPESFGCDSAMPSGQVSNPVLFDPGFVDPRLLDGQLNFDEWVVNGDQPGQNMGAEKFNMDAWLGQVWNSS